MVGILAFTYSDNTSLSKAVLVEHHTHCEAVPKLPNMLAGKPRVGVAGLDCSPHTLQLFGQNSLV